MNSTAGSDSAGVVRRVELEVSGMTCGACAARVERKLNKVDGVHASVNYATRVATVDAPQALDDADLCAVVDKAGYSAERRSSGPADPDDDPDLRTADSLFRRMVIALVLFVPLADLSIMFATVPATRISGWQWILMALAAPVVTYCAWPFYRVAARNLRVGALSMETLISIGIIAATGWSLISMFGEDAEAADVGVWEAIIGSDSIYLEVAAGVTVFVLAGRYFEARARSRAGGALRALAALGAKDVAVVLPDGGEMRIPVGELKEGQRFVVRPGETIAADGLVTSGSSAIDMSAMTGESRPVDVDEGDAVTSGTTALNGRLVIEAARVGDDTAFAAMLRLVEQAQSAKADIQRLADRIAGVFVPIVIVIAAATVAGWLIADGDIDHAVGAGLAVLVIACPCALGLATPTALMVASGRGAQLGIFLKGHQALDASREVDTVVFDKTGTLTNGALDIVSVSVADGHARDGVLRAAATLEAASEHAVAKAIAAAADVDPDGVDAFVAEPGKGVRGVVEGRRVQVGSPRWVAKGAAVPADLARDRRTAEAAGQTVVYVSIDDEVCGAIAVADTVKSSAAETVTELRRLGMRTLLVTGDNAAAAKKVAEEVGIDEVVAEVLPDEKVARIERLREEGRVVAMVGDGINDAPALVTADLGLAIGRGTDVAIAAADIILVRHDLRSVVEALGLARATRQTIRTNMIWAFGYNVAAIPIAAAGLLNPLIAGAAMAFSSFFVVSNSLRLRRFAAGREWAGNDAERAEKVSA
ncbi:heavy metal translocating P-type ATPase [Gordonia sp. Z-3]|uniref:Cation-transporting P-type ATPase B n=1 Tax=Gordonia aquimaris TaxID=2984863 RepID=A0A9X3I5J1_9ACTN|nr:MULTISPECIES: heavy metal translocating P-type ATPase [Gordonia]MCX2964559.1 heavy metal translocating P-type ATPase [Gordonia aquimaris]MED5799419.1 heavy metal translocating P-type ATPase [Gordonia sp. Z-3]